MIVLRAGNRLRAAHTAATTCAAAAAELEKDRSIYTAKGVFSEALVDYMAKFLRSFGDATLRADLGGDTDKIMALVNRHLHVG